MTGNTYFLIVAIEKYNNSTEFGNVSFAEKDARDFSTSFQELGYDPAHMTLLLNSHATASAIVNHLGKIVERTKENDRIVFYFSGHGLNIAGDNLLVPADALWDRASEMCVSIRTVLKELEKAPTVQKIMFLDCCHAGIDLGHLERGGAIIFKGDELEYQFRNAEYSIGFASCKSNQKSHSHAMLSNGVWSHFLIQALKGNADPETYESGVLLAVKLQQYLSEKTYEFLQKNTKGRKVQTPIMFGSSTGDFVVENLNPIFEKRAAERAATQVKLTSVSMYIVENGKIKDLDGFKKRFHFIPDKISHTHDQFVKSISGDIVSNEVSSLSKQLQAAFQYTRTELKANCEEGIGYIETPDFDFSIEVSQSKEDPVKYEVKRSLDAIKNGDIVNDPNFNKIFDAYFDSLSFSFDKPVNIEKWIDTFEERGLDVSYDPSNMDKCVLNLENLDTDIIVKPESLDICFTYAQSPQFLVEAYRETALQLEMANIPLLQ